MPTSAVPRSQVSLPILGAEGEFFPSRYLFVGKNVYLRGRESTRTKMEATDIITLLSRHGVKPTANRLLVARELDRERRPLSLMELECEILTMDKSSVYRVLTLFREHGLVHVVEGNEGVVSYELCRAGHASEDDDLHPHFYCERCHELTCLEGIAIPAISLPGGYRQRAVSYVVKGICGKCALKERERR